MSQIEAAADNTPVVFVTDGGQPQQGMIEHGPANNVEKTVADLRKDYERIVAQILAMTKATPSDDSMSLKTVTVGLAFSAEGELGFIAKAKAGVEASITLCFER